MKKERVDSTTRQPQLPTSQLPAGSAEQWRHLSQGLRLKQMGLAALLAAPIVAALAWQATWRPMWLAPLVTVAVAATIDFLGRVLSWMSGIGDRWLIGASVASQATGLLSGTAFIISVPDFGLPIGIAIAAVFQVIAAFTFTNYLASVGRYLGDAAATQNATRLRNGIFAALMSFAGVGGVSLLVGVLLALIGILTAGIGLYLAFPVGVITLLAAAAPLLYFIAAMYRHYAAVLSRIRATIAAVTSNPGSDVGHNITNDDAAGGA